MLLPCLHSPHLSFSHVRLGCCEISFIVWISLAHAYQNRILEYDEVRRGVSRAQSNMKMLKFSFIFLLKYCQGVVILTDERVRNSLSGWVEIFPSPKKSIKYVSKHKESSLHLNDPQWLSRISLSYIATAAWDVNLLNFFLPHFNRNLSSSFVVDFFLLFSPFLAFTDIQ